MYCRILFVFFLDLTFGHAARGVPPESRATLVGTWRFESVDERPVDQIFYLRFYPDGTSASWPAPRGWGDAKGVSRGKYTVKGNRLSVNTKAGKLNPSLRFALKADRMIQTSDEGNRLVYRRVAQTLEPGLLENGKSAGFLKNPW